jgi:hypothetical protein
MRIIDSRFISFAWVVAVLVACLGCGSSATSATTPGADGASPGSDGAVDGISDSSTPDSGTVDSGTPDSSSPQADTGSPTADAPSDGVPDSASPGEAGSSSCTVAVGCRTFSSYCGTCACEALGANKPAPVCDAGTVSCFVDPCQGHTAVCDQTGHCVLQ